MEVCKEIKEYHNILCGSDYPTFIDKYLELDEFQRIDKIGMLCGGDYTKIFEFRYWYSRLSHSISTALMTWNFTHDKKDTLASLIHDIGTPCFSHCVDYLLGDSEHQGSSELDIFKIIHNSKHFKELLEKDEIRSQDLKSPSTIVENEKPLLCADRLDGVFITGMVWLNKYSLEYVRNIYNNIIVLTNEMGMPELGFKNKKSALKFFDMVFDYSMVLQTNKDKYLMQYIADALKKLIDIKKISLEELYLLKEADIVESLRNNILSWKEFENTREVISTGIVPSQYYVSVESKKRYVNPLCIDDGQVQRLNKVSEYCEYHLQEYFNFIDKPYSYVKKIKKV